MAVAPVGSSQAIYFGSSSPNSATFTVPSGSQPNDVWIVSIALDSSGTTVTTPTGWSKPVDSLVAGASHLYVFCKVLTSGDIAAGAITFNFSTYANVAAVSWGSFRGANVTTVVDATSAIVSSGGASSYAMASVTASVAGDYLLTAFTSEGGSSPAFTGATAAPAGMTGYTESNGNYLALAIGREARASSGATGTRTWSTGFIAGQAVQLLLKSGNQAPTVSISPAGPIAVANGTSAHLTAVASDPDGSIASYAWSKVSGPASPTVGTPTASSSTIGNFTVNGTYVYQCVVTDNGGLTATATITITVAANQAPIVSAGADMVVSLSAGAVTLAGTATDPDGLIATLAWTLLSAPGGSTKSSTDITSATSSPGTQSASLNGGFTADVSGAFTFRLTAVDNSGASTTDDVVFDFSVQGIWTPNQTVITIPPTGAKVRVRVRIIAPGAGTKFWEDTNGVMPGSGSPWGIGGIVGVAAFDVYADGIPMRNAIGVTPDAAERATVAYYEATPAKPVEIRVRSRYSLSGQEIASALSEPVSFATAQSGAWVKDPLDPTLNMKVTLISWGDMVRPMRGTILTPIGRDDDIVLSRRSGKRRFPISIDTLTLADREALEDMITSGRVLLFQVEPEPPENVGQQWYFTIAGDYNEARYGTSVKHSGRTITAAVIEQAAP